MFALILIYLAYYSWQESVEFHNADLSGKAETLMMRPVVDET